MNAAALGKMFTHFACEFGLTAVEHWAKNANASNGKEAMDVWYRERHERIVAANMDLTANILAHHGVVVSDESKFHESWAATFGFTTNSIAIAGCEIFGVPRSAGFGEFLPLDPAAAARLEEHSTRLLEELNHGRLKLFDE